MSKLETNTIDTVSGSTTLTLGGTNATTIAQDSATTITGLKSTGIDDNATSTAVEIDSSNDLNMLSGNKFIANRADNTRTVSLYCDNSAGYVETSFDPIVLKSAGRISFEANGSERMRINSDGKVGIGDTALSSNAILSVEGDIGSPLFKLYDKRSTSTVDVMHLNSSFGGTEVKHFQIEADGDVQNTNNSYGSLSDRRFKENETDANSQWNDIKALQIKNYNLKIFPDITHLGVIAQDLEASGMNGLVKNKPEELYTENDVLPEGKNIGDIKEESYKEVKYSVLYMKSVKALQEAMERIETLEARITALENA